MSSKRIDFLYVIKSIIVNDCFVICVGLSLLSKTVDMTLKLNRYRRLEIWRPLLVLCQMHMAYGKGHAGATDRCTKLSEMNKNQI